MHFSRLGDDRQVTIRGLRGTVVELDAASERLEVDLQGAEFNGDRRAAPRSSYEPYLVCEFPNGDRCSF